MKKPLAIMTAAVLTAGLTAAATAFASDDGARMSDVQHRKTMGGMHHPQDVQQDDESKKAGSMSDVQHRKHMGGLKHEGSDKPKGD